MKGLEKLKLEKLNSLKELKELEIELKELKIEIMKERFWKKTRNRDKNRNNIKTGERNKRKKNRKAKRKIETMVRKAAIEIWEDIESIEGREAEIKRKLESLKKEK